MARKRHSDKDVLKPLREIELKLAGGGDTKLGVIYGKGSSERSASKCRKPARCPERKLTHVRRWRRLGASFVCEGYRGNRVAVIKKRCGTLVDLAYEIAEAEQIEMPDRRHVTPHILKHTAIA